MNTKPLRPTSTASLKRLAHGLKKHRELNQSEAMEHAAILTGYRNLREAQLAFGETLASSVLITAHFYDEIGRRTLETRVPLSRHLRSFLRPKHLQICDHFEKMSMVAEDHIEAEFNQLQESFVRHRIAQVARTLQFMDATGLKPSDEEIYGHPTFCKQQRIPEQDHATTWMAPKTGVLVMMDEPYDHVDHINQIAQRRKDWAQSNGFVVRRLNWGGTYRPEQGSVCDLVSRVGQGVFIDQIIARLEQAEPGFREDAALWTLHTDA